MSLHLHVVYPRWDLPNEVRREIQHFQLVEGGQTGGEAADAIAAEPQLKHTTLAFLFVQN